MTDHSPALPERTPADPRLTADDATWLLEMVGGNRSATEWQRAEATRLLIPIAMSMCTCQTITGGAVARSASCLLHPPASAELAELRALVASQRETITTLTGELASSRRWQQQHRHNANRARQAARQTLAGLNKFKAENVELRAALSRAEADGERLDWLADNNVIDFVSATRDVWRFGLPRVEGDDLRAAIDAARSSAVRPPTAELHCDACDEAMVRSGADDWFHCPKCSYAVRPLSEGNHA